MEVDFDYCDKSVWVQYISETIIPLRTCALNLLNFWDYLANYVGLPISEILNDESLKVKLLGGVKENGEFMARSLALLYKSFFGWSLYNLNVYLLHKSEKLEIEIDTIREKTDFISFINTILSHCENIIKSAYENGIIEVQERSNSTIEANLLFNSDDELIEEINKLYENIIKFTINYNQKTLFVWTLRKNTRRYLTFQYKKLQDSDCFEKLCVFIGLHRYFSLEIPKVEGTKIADDIERGYTIWELANQFGYMVYDLNNYIFNSFKRNSLIYKLFEQIIEVPEDIQQQHKDKIERLESLWEVPDEHNRTKRDESGYGTWTYKYTISGAFLTEFQRTPSQQSRYSTERGECSESLLDFLDAISPALFLNKVDLIINNNWIWYEERA